jgi:glycosyltransferase involved in cell wall biosynthesis
MAHFHDDKMADPQERPLVSIIVPVYNNMEGILACLTALESQTYPSHRYHVIVVDNGSEETVRIPEDSFPHARLTREHKPGSYAARNKGLSLARGGIIGFTDSDCIPAANWIDEGVKTLEEGQGCDVVAGHIDVFIGNDSIRSATEVYDSMSFDMPERRFTSISFAATANLFAHRTVFDTVGPFDERLRSGGDFEWSTRIAAANLRLITASNVTVSHPARRTIADLCKRKMRLAGGHHDMKTLGIQARGFAPAPHKWLFPPVRRIASILLDDRVKGVDERLRVVCVALLEQYAYGTERIRLLAGGSSRR